jgi:hypothetical protein
MPTHVPIAAVGSREPDKRPQPIPRAVRLAIELMVRGAEADADGQPPDVVEAARLAGLKPTTLRKYLTRPSVLSLIRRERKAYRQAILCGQEAALVQIRNKSANAMARIAATRLLEELDSEEHLRPASVSAGVTIRIINQPAVPTPHGPVIDITPTVPASDRAEPATSDPNPIFRAPRAW